MLDSPRKTFLLTLKKVFNPVLMNNDIEEVAQLMKIGLPVAERIAKELQEEGFITIIGLGGNIALTQEGHKAAANPSWS